MRAAHLVHALQSYKGMGKAQLTCHKGCHCESTIVDGTVSCSLRCMLMLLHTC